MTPGLFMLFSLALTYGSVAANYKDDYDLGFSLKGKQVNGSVFFSDIGTGENSLMCTTTKPHLKLKPVWTFPNGTVLPRCKRNRPGPGLCMQNEKQKVLLTHDRSDENTTYPTGLYHCLIMHSTGHYVDMGINIKNLPLCPKTLHLIKYKDSGREHKFRLVDRVSAGWRMFGILTCITDNILDEWELRFMRDPVRCWEKVMSKWLDDGESEDYPVTWQGLYNLLKDAEYGEVEMELSKAVRLATSDPDLEIDEDCNR